LSRSPSKRDTTRVRVPPLTRCQEPLTRQVSNVMRSSHCGASPTWANGSGLTGLLFPFVFHASPIVVSFV
jgi:hypothetical protein